MFQMNKGLCLVNQEILQLKCPDCISTIDETNCTGLGIYNCRADINCNYLELELYTITFPIICASNYIHTWFS